MAGCHGEILDPEAAAGEPADEPGGEDGQPGGDCATCDPTPPVAEDGTVAVMLHPGPTAVTGAPVAVAFGVPFPRGALTTVDELRVTVDGDEIPSHAVELTRWRDLGEGNRPESVRAALVHIEMAFADATPLPVAVEYGAPRALVLEAPADATASWVSIASGDMPDEYPALDAVTEPAVYATLPPAWLGDCGLRSWTTPVDSAGPMGWFDSSFVEFARTAVNDVDPRVVELIDYVSDPEPWLFDRAMTLFGAYVRTGDVAWLRRAHRATQFYARHVAADGSFDLKPGDLKYSYGQAMLADLMLTGDTRLLAPIERVASQAAAWNPSYTVGRNFFTERHQTYALLGALSAWEATGDASYAQQARTIARASFDLAKNPPGGWANDGCMLHTFDSHEGAGGAAPVCSPWMSALFADAVWRYYVHSGDADALEFLANLGAFIAAKGLYNGAYDNLDYTLPWYLVSSEVQFTDDGPWGDIQHACDVAGLLGKAAYAARQLSRDSSAITGALDELLVTCEVSLEHAHRPGGPEAGKSEWRLAPPRKFNWWFGTTSDLGWFLDRMAE